jgi:uncharacterized membrane protein
MLNEGKALALRALRYTRSIATGIYLRSSVQVRIFLILAPLFGVFSVFINPPMQIPDEPQHYLRAYTLSELNISPDSSDGVRFGYTVPTYVSEMVHENTQGSAPVYRANLSAIKKYFHNQNSSDSRSIVNFENTAVYPPVAYIPQTLSVMLGKILHLPLMYGFYVGRLLNFLLWAVLLYIALTITPIARWLMLVLALLPMSVYEASSLSADATINGLTFLTIALFLYLYNQAKVTFKQISLATICLAIIGAIKPTYVVFVLPFLLLPRTKFESRRQQAKLLGGMLLVVLAVSIVWFLSVANISSHIHDILRPGEHIVPSLQVRHILHNPLHFVWVNIHTIVLHNFSYIGNSAIGILGWLDIPLPGYSYLMAYLLIGLAVLKDGNHFPKRFRALSFRMTLLLTGLLATSALAAVFYIGYTVVGANLIEGLQGRYFLPIWLIMLAAIIAPAYKLQISDRNFTIIVVSVLSVAMLTSFFYVLDANYLRILYPIG